MSLIFPDGSRTVTTGPGGRPMDFSKPFNQQPGHKKSPAQRPTSQQPAAPQSLDMSSYSPGRARPVQSQSQGTPFQAYSPQQSTSYSANQDGVQRTYTDNVFQGGAGNYGNAPDGQRPSPFTQGATGLGGQQFSDPRQAFAQRDAMIQRINEARAPMFAGAGTYLGEGAPPPTWGQKPPLDFNTLMGQANEMVASGWQNPFAQQNFGAPQYQIGVPGGMLPQPTPLAEPAMPPMHNGLPVVYQNGVAGTVDLGSAGRFPGMTGTLGGPGFRPLPQQPPAPPQFGGGYSQPSPRPEMPGGYRPGQAQPVQQSFGTPYGGGNSGGAGTSGDSLPLGSYGQSQSSDNAYQPYVNQSGQKFAGSISFAPGTPQSYMNQAYGQWANNSGYYQQRSQQVSGDPRGAYAGTPDNRPAGLMAQPDMTGQRESVSYDQGGNPVFQTTADFGEPPAQSGIRHWTDNPRYQQPQFQEPAIPQVAGTTDFFAGRTAPPASGPAVQPREGPSQLGTYVSPRARAITLPGRKPPPQVRRVQV